MTTQEIKAILNAARTAGLKYYSARDRANQLERRLTSGKTVQYEDTGASHERNGNTVEKNLCTLSDYQSEKEKCKAALADPYCRAGKLIYLVKDERQRNVLNRYYLYCKSWVQIAAEMGISVRHVHNLRGYAILEISKKA